MRVGLLLLVSVLASLGASASARTITFGDVRRIVSFASPQLSPDGQRLVYARSTADFSHDRIDTQLYLMDVRTHRSHALTYDRRGVSEPRWSPSGDAIAFLANTPTGAKKKPQAQIFVMPMNGGDARKVTDVSTGVLRYTWSPDGKQFAYLAQDIVPDPKRIAAHHDAFQVGDNDYLHTTATQPVHLWTTCACGGNPHRLTHGSWSLDTVNPSSGGTLSWSADGRSIAVVRFPTPLYGDSLGSQVVIVNARTGAMQHLTHNSGLEGNPLFAPAGPLVAYQRNANGDPANGFAAYVTQPGGGAGRDIRIGIGRNIDGMAWSANGRAMYLYGPDDSYESLWYRPIDGAPQRVDLGSVAFARPGNAARDGAFAFVGTTANHPQELYLLPSPHARPIALTNENAFIDHLQLGRVSEVGWRNDGFSEDGVLVYPPGFVRGRHYPLVLLIHGGPQSASTIAWSSQAQLFAAHGYVIFSPNYRGSTNLGDRYQHAILKDAGAGPGRDAMAGLAAVERMGIVDTSRIGVSGWSYGGYMTSWLIGHHHRWKVAVAGAALNDWIYDYNIAFYVHTDEPYFGGSPWNPAYNAMWRAQSPITDAPLVRTPTLIMGDIGDNNVVIANSFAMYHALKDNHVPVKFIAYPVHGHFPSDPVRAQDIMQHWLSWLDRYLR